MKTDSYKPYELVATPFQIIDQSGTILYVNQYWLEHLGYTKDEVIDKKYIDFLSEKSKKTYKEKMSSFKQKNKLDNIICEVINKQGQMIYGLFNGTAKLDSENNITKFFCTFSDITDTIKQKEELEFKELYRKTVFNAEPDILVCTYGDKIDDGNKAMLEFTGYNSVNEFKKQYDCICELFEENNGYLQKEMNGINWLDYIYANPEKYHKVLMKKNNDKYIFHVYARKLNFDTLNRSIVIFNDITDLISYQKKLSSSEKYLKKAQQLSKMGYWELDIQNNTSKWSEETFRIFELNPNKNLVTPETYFSYILSEDLENTKKVLNDTIKDKKPYKLTYRIKTKNGNLKYIYEEADLECDKQGKPLSLFGYSIDITEKENILEKLKEKEDLMLLQSKHAAMGEMISMIAHQWRQPLSIISMIVNNILVDIDLNEFNKDQAKESAVSINQQIQELSKTIDDFRNFFKPIKQKELTNLKDIFHNLIIMVGKSLENNGINLLEEYNTTNKIETYTRELLQVLINIIKNAKEILIENKIDNPQITIKTDENDKEFIIKIYDNAGGIENSIIDKIFDPYFTTKDKQSGTGIGLYMSKTIIEKHLNGSLGVENYKYGACFTIKLPK